MFQPTTSAEQIRSIAKDRLVKPLAERWPPMARQSAEAQERELADLTRDVVDLLPARESAESLALIVDRAWTTLRRTHRGVTWPKSATVRDAVDGAVADWRAKSGAAGKDRLPQRPTLPSPKVCMAKADHFRELGATALADYWQRMASDAAMAWRAWGAAGGRDIDAEALKGTETGKSA